MMLIRVLLLSLLWAGSAVAADSPARQKQVLIMMSSHNSAAKTELLEKAAADQPFNLVHLSLKDKSLEQVAGAWKKADLLLMDGINPALSKFIFGKYKELPAQFPALKMISLGDLENPVFNQNIDKAKHQRLGEYFSNAGRKNYRNMMAYISSEVLALGEQAVEAPVEVPLTGLYHPNYVDGVSADEQAFFDWLAPKAGQAAIGIAIHRSVIDYEQQQIVDALINGIEARGQRAFGYFYEGNDEELPYTELLLDEQQQARVQLMINYRSLHYVEKRRSEFTRIGVPVIHALNYTDGSPEEYRQSNTGISPGLTPFFLVMPEDTGSTDPTIIAAVEDGRKVVMADQLNALVERAVNHAVLAVTANADKKVAAFIWNYPPGEKNVGAAFLDVPSSLEQIAKAMQAEGYAVTPKSAKALIEAAGQLLRPYYRNEDASGLIEKNLADYLPLSTYLAWFEALPADVQKAIVERWGEPKDNPMLTERNGEMAFVIPRMEMGNFIVMPQGARSDSKKDHAKLYHDMKTPVNHSYLAIYLYAKQVFEADAFIHLGTHGSQEWLLGKERGLSIHDSPSLAAGNVPVFYPYIIDNVGEAMQAKRRGRATMISHLTPGFAKAGLYAEVAKLNELLGNYLILDDGQTKANTQAEIEKLVAELNLLPELQLTAEQFNQGFDSELARLQDHLNEMAQQAQPLGVHIFGLLPEDAHLYSTILQMLGDEFTAAAGEYEQQQGMAVPEEEQLDRLQVTRLEALPGFQLLKAHFAGKSLVDLPEALKLQLDEAGKHWANFQNIAEVENLMLALSANYIPVSYGGDPIRNPDVAPTGRNLIGFNPSKVPSKEAYEAGVKLMEQTINDYRAEHGEFPDKLAYSLWSLETMRHHGALEAQVLHAMGSSPSGINKAGWWAPRSSR